MKNTILKTYLLGVVIGIAVTIQAHSAETQPKEQSAKQFFSEIKKNFPVDKLEKIELCVQFNPMLSLRNPTENSICSIATSSKIYKDKNHYLFDIQSKKYINLKNELFKSSSFVKVNELYPKNQIKTVLKFTFKTGVFFISQHHTKNKGTWLKVGNKKLLLDISRKEFYQIISENTINNENNLKLLFNKLNKALITLAYSAEDKPKEKQKRLFKKIRNQLNFNKVKDIQLCITDHNKQKLYFDFPDYNAKEDFEHTFFMKGVCSHIDKNDEIKKTINNIKKTKFTSPKYDCTGGIPSVFIKITTNKEQLWMTAESYINNEFCFDIFGKEGRTFALVSAKDVYSLFSENNLNLFKPKE